MTAQEQVLQFIDECLEGTDCFLVSFKVKPTNNYKFYIDSDSGFTLEKCVRINRKMRKMIEEAELYPDGDVSLEISSPGIDIPLTFTRQYIKNIGRKLEIELKDEAAKGIIAKLIEVKEDSIVMEKIPFTQKGRKVVEKEAETFEIKLEDIKTATVCFEI